MQAIEDAELEQHRKLVGLLNSGSYDDETALQGADGHNNGRSATGEQQLWVQQYMPRSYLQLLSAEAVNVGVLSWLKSWDAAVFGTQPNDKKLARLGLQEQAALGAVKAAQEDQRPKCKGILLAGNPGAITPRLTDTAQRYCIYDDRLQLYQMCQAGAP
jgi:hypothetical protein